MTLACRHRYADLQLGRETFAEWLFCSGKGKNVTTGMYRIFQGLNFDKTVKSRPANRITKSLIGLIDMGRLWKKVHIQGVVVVCQGRNETGRILSV